MSGPSFSNIDRWFFEYVEGNLSPEQEAQLEAFILNHPELELDLDAWKSATIEPAYYEFPNQNTLLQPEKKKRRVIPFFWGTVGTVSIALILFFLWPNNQTNKTSHQSNSINNKHSKVHHSSAQNQSFTASKTNVKKSNYSLNHSNLSGIHYQANRYSIPLSNTLLNSCVQTNIEPEEINDYLISAHSSPLVTKQRASQILLRPGIDLKLMVKETPVLNGMLSEFEADVLEQAEIQIKYDTYIEKERELVEKMSQLENLLIPENFNYTKLVSLSTEAKQKFIKIQPRTLGQASRISGVNPSDVQILMLYMGR